MTIHKIYLSPSSRGLTPYSYNGLTIGTSREPLLDAARYLLDSGLAQPDDVVEAYRDTRLCLRAFVEKAARLTTSETASGVRFRLFKRDESPAHASKDTASTYPTSPYFRQSV